MMTDIRQRAGHPGRSGRLSFPRGWFLLALLAVGLWGARPAPAQAAPPASDETAATAPSIPLNRLLWSNLDIIRLNPLGLESQNRFVFQRRLMESQSKLFRDTFINRGLNLKLNPAYLKVGPIVDVQPIALFNLRLGFELVRYFGTFGYLRSYDAAGSDYADDSRGATESEAYSTSGTHLFVEPTLQVKVGRVAIRSKFAFERWNLNLQDSDPSVDGGDAFFYDATLDTLVPNGKLIWANDSDVLYVPGGKLTAGLRFSGVFPGTEDSHIRLGPLLAWSFHTRDYSRFNKPTLLLVTGWYLDHPNRVGAMPYILLGFSFSKDFLRTPL